jgi:hypothetical protein
MGQAIVGGMNMNPLYNDTKHIDIKKEKTISIQKEIVHNFRVENGYISPQYDKQVILRSCKSDFRSFEKAADSIISGNKFSLKLLLKKKDPSINDKREIINISRKVKKMRIIKEKIITCKELVEDFRRKENHGAIHDLYIQVRDQFHAYGLDIGKFCENRGNKKYQINYLPDILGDNVPLLRNTIQSCYKSDLGQFLRTAERAHDYWHRRAEKSKKWYRFTKPDEQAMKLAARFRTLKQTLKGDIAAATQLAEKRCLQDIHDIYARTVDAFKLGGLDVYAMRTCRPRYNPAFKPDPITLDTPSLADRMGNPTEDMKKLRLRADALEKELYQKLEAIDDPKFEKKIKKIEFVSHGSPTSIDKKREILKQYTNKRLLALTKIKEIVDVDESDSLYKTENYALLHDKYKDIAKLFLFVGEDVYKNGKNAPSYNPYFHQRPLAIEKSMPLTDNIPDRNPGYTGFADVVEPWDGYYKEPAPIEIHARDKS